MGNFPCNQRANEQKVVFQAPATQVTWTHGDSFPSCLPGLWMIEMDSSVMAARTNCRLGEWHVSKRYKFLGFQDHPLALSLYMLHLTRPVASMEPGAGIPPGKKKKKQESDEESRDAWVFPLSKREAREKTHPTQGPPNQLGSPCPPSLPPASLASEAWPLSLCASATTASPGGRRTAPTGPGAQKATGRREVGHAVGRESRDLFNRVVEALQC